MPTPLEKIEAHAASRLELPPGRTPGSELQRYKRFLKVETHRLKILHRGGAKGLEVCGLRSAMMDVLLKYLLQAVIQSIPAPKSQKPPPIALVAIGGYGRGELNPFSDIDYMLLHGGDLDSRGKPGPWLEQLNHDLLYTIWDIGLKVGHSLRRVEDCVNAANEDMKSKTGLLEARLITGDTALFKRMQSVVLAKCVRGQEAKYLQARIEDQIARRAKYGNSATMQEPNIKDGCGGLRDYQNLFWMAEFKYRVHSLDELETRELISSADNRQLTAAYDFLLRVRNELHYHVNRPSDVLTKSVQPAVAYQLGFTDRSPVRRLEKFMREVYRHMRNIYLITRTLEQRLALLPQPDRRIPSLADLLKRGRRKVSEQAVDGFHFSEGEVRPASNRVFKDQPRRLMKVFLYAQQRGLRLSPDVCALIRQNLALVDRSFRRDQHVRETFFEILNQRGNVAPILRAMHEVEFLGKYITEFGGLTCLVQHEFYHQYTADEHTLVCISKLDKVWQATERPFNNYAELFRDIEQPFLLYLALLLHDAGKSLQDRAHVEAGLKLALSAARRLELDGAATHSLCLIIENHLLMTQVSQRRDLDDRAEIRAFAAKVQTVENLNLLTLHSLADSLGTSDHLWNDFKDSLLRSLYTRAKNVLVGGTEFIRAGERQRELLIEEVLHLLPPSFIEDEVVAHFTELPNRYSQIHPAKRIAADITLAHRFMHLQITEEDRALQPVIDWHNEPDRGYTAVSVCTWDRAGLFSKIAGSFTAAGLNILSAEILTRSDGIIIDTFFVTDALTGLLVNREEREHFENYLIQTLTGELDLAALIRRRPVRRPLYSTFEESRMPTRIEFDNISAETRTIIDVETEDRIGLLYTISQAQVEMDLDLSVAKICTENGAAIDTFYVSEKRGGKITAPERLKFIEKKLRAAIASLDK